MPTDLVVGIVDAIPSDARSAIADKFGISIVDLTEELSEFDYFYRTERFGQLQSHEIAERITSIEFLTLDRVHERWLMFALSHEQRRAELIGMVGFWVAKFAERGLTHIVENTVAPHWGYSYSQYVAARLSNIRYLTVHANLYLQSVVVHEGLHDRAIRYGPPGVPPKVKAFLEEMASKVSHPAIAATYINNASRIYPLMRNVFGRVHRGMVVHRKSGNFTRTDMRSRPFARLKYTQRVIARTVDNYGKFRKLEKEYKRYCVAPNPTLEEKGRSIVFFAHLQPEATTAPLAFFYHDARMVAHDLIDRGYAVYYKEHPISFLPTIDDTICLTPEYRSKEYYRDLAEMGCKLLSVDADNDVLLDKFDFAATCTGTIAMQAAAKGKRTIAFGAPWFSGMPGLVDARNGLKTSPEELRVRPAPTLDGVLDYYANTHGHGLPPISDEASKYDHYLALAELIRSL